MPTSTQQKQEVFKTIWKKACDLVHGGAMSPWDFKQYVLGTMFYRYISENITTYINNLQREAGIANFDYTTFSDEEAMLAKDDIVREKGFFILPSQLFCNVVKHARNNADLNTTLGQIFRDIEGSAVGTDSEDDIAGLFENFDVNNSSLGATVAIRNSYLTQILEAIANMDLKDPQNNHIDMFGDAYEYLIGMYAANGGKVGGQYFTPQEVSELLARIVTDGKKQVRKVYDPACGSGSLLLQMCKVLGKENVVNGFYGQEIEKTTYNLARINMFLHDVNYEKFNIAWADTLLSPQHLDDAPFDAIVSNPPYSISWAGDDDVTLINDPRFSPAGVLAPKSKADLAFTMHMLYNLATDGTAAIVEFPGVLYRGGAEQKIRKYLVDNNYVDTVIQLPDNLFFGVGIATCIIVLKKNKKDSNVLFIDASKMFIHEGNKNKLSAENIESIINLYREHADAEYTAALVSHDEVENNGYNLSVSTYVAHEHNREEVDIDELERELAEVVAHENSLRNEINELIKKIR